MFHTKHVLIQYELQKYRLVYQSDFLFRTATKPCKGKIKLITLKKVGFETFTTGDR